MRVVAGVARGRLLQAPRSTATRPTGDRAREAIFDMLASLGAVEGAAVVDLFAGSGALGIEALSRGADAATFVDRDERALAAVSANLGVLGPLADRAQVVRAEALAWLGTPSAGSGGWDLALCDPPYAFSAWPALLGRLGSLAVGVVVAESSHAIDPGPAWELLRSRRYGGTVVTLARPLPRPPAKGPQ